MKNRLFHSIGITALVIGAQLTYCAVFNFSSAMTNLPLPKYSFSGPNGNIPRVVSTMSLLPALLFGLGSQIGCGRDSSENWDTSGAGLLENHCREFEYSKEEGFADRVHDLSEKDFTEVIKYCKPEDNFEASQTKITDDCKNAFEKLIPFDQENLSTFSEEDAESYKEGVMGGLIYLMFVKLAVPSDGALLGQNASGVCDSYYDLLEPLYFDGETLTEEEKTQLESQSHVKLLLFLISRIDSIKVDPDLPEEGVMGRESDGVMEIWPKLTPSSMADTFLHEARHIGFQEARHIECDSSDTRNCDQGIDGAIGLSMMWRDAAIHGSYGVLPENIFGNDEVKLAIYNHCMDLGYMLNNPSHHLRLIFEDVDSCVTEIWQDDEALSDWMEKLGYSNLNRTFHFNNQTPAEILERERWSSTR